MKKYDLVVLGAGSGGLAAAKRAASYGASVAILEGDRIGGTCVIRGCVPKKMLVYGSMYGEYINNCSPYGFDIGNVKFNSEVLLRNVEREVMRISGLHKKFLDNNGVDILNGWGEFKDSSSILVMDRENDRLLQEIQAERILIAVGGMPIRPAIEGSLLGWISDDMFRLKSFPAQVIIIGGGFIACEFACILNGLGVKVTHLVRGDYLLKGFDRELSVALQEAMKLNGIDLRFGVSPVLVEGEPGALNVSTNLGQKLFSNGILFATGRKPFIDNLKLDNAGILINEDKIIVDNQNRTNKNNIFAIGDVTDRVNLTPVAVDEGRAFADRIYGGSDRIVNYDLVPRAVFSQPEIASVGLDEERAVSILGKENVKVFRSQFRPLSSSISKSPNKCILKLVVNKSSEQILGCHMIGEHAAEIIQMASIALTLGAKKSDFDLTMALHPTIAEEFVTMK